MSNQILDQMQHFSNIYGKELTVGGTKWRYYRLGQGPTLFWLTGGLRRVAFGYPAMESLAKKYTVISPDYPPAKTFDEFNRGFEAILQAEGIQRFLLAGQSYGGLLAQAFLALHPEAVETLTLSSSGPMDYGIAWLPAEYLMIGLVRILPQRMVKDLLAKSLGKFVSVPEAGRGDWQGAFHDTLEHDLGRADVVSHFAVAADMIKKRIIRPEAFRDWPGRVIVLGSEDDPTQGKGDQAKYEKLFGRQVKMVSLGAMGHTAALLDPERFTDLLEQALAK